VWQKSVTTNSMSRVPAVFRTLPFATIPPMRKRLSGGASPAATSEGSKKYITLPS
jgi:hypothetical protein